MSEKLKNKTCGECKHYKPYNEKICLYVHRTCVPPKTKACSSFAKSTNGDVIRQMNNEELAEFLSTQVICPNCPARTEHCIGNASKVCKKNWLAWLNAPAERIVFDEPKEGDFCTVLNCGGRLEYVPDGECCCHISPPCEACENSKLTCNKCGKVYEVEDE